LDGTLEPHEESQIRTHLETCTACQAAWQITRHAEQTLLTARENLPNAGDLSAGFYAKLAQTPARPKLRLRYFAAPALAAVLLGVFLWRPTTTQNSVALLPTEKNNTPTEIAHAPDPAPQKAPSQSPAKPRDIAQNSPTAPSKPVRLVASLKPASKVEPKWLKSGGSSTVASAISQNPQDSRRLSFAFDAKASSNMPPISEMEIEVTDTERGFESKTHTSEEIESNGTRTVTIEENEPTPRIETLLLREEQE
jgi:hypothetical protein